jgi:hypothetical protein
VPPGKVNTAYTFTLMAAGGTPPYQWTLTMGALPAGLSLSATGEISGTPTAPGMSTFTVQVEDAAAATATASTQLTLSVIP